MNDIKFVSLADSAFEKIESDILSGVYKKGDTITEIELSQNLGISRTPIREAVKRLEQENLVKLTARGIVVIGLTSRDIEDIFDLRIRVEGLAAAKCAEIFNSEQIEELKGIVELQEFYTQKKKTEDINQTDSRFHEYIYMNCGSDILASVLSSFHRQVQMYRKQSVENFDRAILAVAEHRKIFEAISQGKRDEAEFLSVEHIKNAKKSILKNL